MKNYIIIINCLLLLLTSCKKDEQQAQNRPAPVISKVTPAIGQSGDTIVIDGVNFSAQMQANEVAVNGIPAQVIAASADKIKAIIPLFSQSGNLLVTVNNVSAKGPMLTVIPSPAVKNISTEYGFAGDTLTLNGEHFAPEKNDNYIELSGQRTPVVKQQGDTLLKVLIIAGNENGRLFYSTYNGKKKEITQKITLRKPYTGNLMDAIKQDPGFSYTNAILERMKEFYPAFYQKVQSIWNSADPHTLFLRDNDALKKRNPRFTSVNYVRQFADPQSFYYVFLASTINGNITRDKFESKEYPSVLSEEEMWGGPGSGGNPDFFIPVSLIHTTEVSSASIFYNDPDKITKTDLKATNGIIHQIE
ncbi:hypothetical protein GCM10023149_15800 [Mucilaginibacter gynuensis]|uniref:FAS1 domain-containing protein n=1 Tax=Mucilaginibacter gynuensis TaxID=1302236 RepID=A0ABP8G5V9_9SPHI